MKIPNWTDIYPQGTREGDEEQKFFIALARHPKYVWRSTSGLAKETGLTKVRVEEIIAKYHKKHMVFQSPSNEDNWAYWNRCPDMLPKDESTITEKDQSDRIKKVIKP